MQETSKCTFSPSLWCLAAQLLGCETKKVILLAEEGTIYVQSVRIVVIVVIIHLVTFPDFDN